MNLLNDGPAVIELGSVKTNVKMANRAMELSNTASFRGCMGLIGRPKRVYWTGILSRLVVAECRGSDQWQLNMPRDGIERRASSVGV